MADPRSLQVLNAAKAILGGISVAGGYETDVGQCVLMDSQVNPAELRLPAILLGTVSDRYTDNFAHTQHNQLYMNALAYVEGLWDLHGRAHRLAADMHKALHAAFITDRWGGLVVTYRPQVSYPFMDVDGETCGVSFDFLVQYRANEADPYLPP